MPFEIDRKLIILMPLTSDYYYYYFYWSIFFACTAFLCDMFCMCVYCEYFIHLEHIRSALIHCLIPVLCAMCFFCIPNTQYCAQAMTLCLCTRSRHINHIIVIVFAFSESSGLNEKLGTQVSCFLAASLNDEFEYRHE